MKIHEKYIRRCIQLGENGLGNTAPNPMVGCLIVHNETIIGEGFTSHYGGAHAEVNAVTSVLDKNLLSESTLYVTLEPCSHYGKTPPCANMIVEHKIPKVVIGLKDPHDKVAGKGIQKLRDAGCQVIVGVLEKECRWHHRRFLSFQEKKRPYIILKWAETRDGFIAPSSTSRTENPEPYWITNTNSRQLVHQWRSEEHAILVGTQTVLEDNPKLTVRNWTGSNPIRIVLDRTLKIPNHFNILDSETKTIVITEVEDESKYAKPPDYEIIDFSNNVVSQICEILYTYSITSLIVEGGSHTLQSFIDSGIWDEARIFKGDKAFGDGLHAPEINGTPINENNIFSDTLTILTP
ncbi:bifunctional diaminohydroxyphosphoribosylaminopyrimidine deaminase/5-amino-6-(5-phosphoribosylamino)uracil reductase RibD [Flagellimonas sp. S174]|uniref:bifunctional diaminohydroxyphosphoribosylaminopyrimidine deaminase/5-amino-6-(5-phosphoribosylamino)uracil reductase RibD n=1 Tax=Flagellimonas sp. S174 TaxID=3410790 RepID=UPI003BF4675C